MSFRNDESWTYKYCFCFSPHVSPVFFKVFSHFPRLTCRVLRFQPPAAGLKRQAKRKMEAQDKAQAKSLKAGTGGGPSVFFLAGGNAHNFSGGFQRGLVLNGESHLEMDDDWGIPLWQNGSHLYISFGPRKPVMNGVLAPTKRFYNPCN